ncbi:hypothetical protein L3X38_017778 [Prunus dulcis]|uniref:Uncharacterized protein n=1 Tax=Prunus dulcis TaxID=3755 RepID=A0AAD4WAJ0_PRUDU|nr:hypothetical protein L3X38_017778 [Prunus dulcis]
MGERILLARVEANAERLNVHLLIIVEDTFNERARVWLCLEGLMVAALLTLKTSDLLKEKSHGRVGMREDTRSLRLVVWVAFALAEPGLDWGTMTGDHWLVWLGVFNILGKILLGTLVVSLFPVTLQGATIMLQLDILEDKEEEAVVKLRTPVWCLPKALRYLNKLYVGSENGSLAQSFDVGLCASCCGGDTCPWKLGSALGSFGRWLPL